MTPDVRVCADVNELSLRAAEAAVTTVNDAVRRHGRCSFVLSGGSTPRTFYGLLASEFREQQVSFDTRDRLFHETWMTPANSASGQKPKNTSLDDFERLLIGVDNYGWYQAQFWKRAETVYKAQGLAFLEGVKAAFPHGTPPLTMPETLARLEKINPGFVEWAESLSRQPKP